MQKTITDLNILVVYDSTYGNTELVSKAFCEAVYSPHTVKRVLVGSFKSADLSGVDVLLVGSPTQGGMATKPIQEFIDTMQPDSLKGIAVAAYDTRYAISEHGIGLKVLMKTIGFGAPRIATALQRKGGKLILKPEGFLVENKEGPLKEGELDRAQHWMERITELSLKS